MSNDACIVLPSFSVIATQNITTRKISFVLEIQIINDPLKASGIFGEFVIRYREVNASFPIKCIGPILKPFLEILKTVQVPFKLL